jgi:hypothetical protein
MGIMSGPFFLPIEEEERKRGESGACYLKLYHTSIKDDGDT